MRHLLTYGTFFLLAQITSVCNFFTYIRYIQQGLVKQQDGECSQLVIKYLHKSSVKSIGHGSDTQINFIIHIFILSLFYSSNKMCGEFGNKCLP